MAEFKRTVIINDTADVTSTTTSLKIDGFAEFKPAEITEVNFAASVAEVKYKAVFTLPSGITGSIYRLDLELGVDGHHPSYMQTAEVTEKFDFNYECAGGTPTAMAATIVREYDAETSIKQRSDFTLTASAGTITIECKDPHFRLRTIKFIKITNTTLTGYQDFTDETPTITETKNVIGFGDELWMQEHIQFPNHVNRRLWRTRNQNRVKPDTDYCQFVINIKQPRGITGNGVFGQYMESMSSYIIYAAGTISTGASGEIMKGLEKIVDKYNKINPNPTSGSPMIEVITFDDVAGTIGS